MYRKVNGLMKCLNSRSNHFLQSLSGKFSLRISESGGGFGEIYSVSGDYVDGYGTKISRSGKEDYWFGSAR